MKDLIKDIITYLKENDEARDRFNRMIRRNCNHPDITIIGSSEGVKIFNPNSDILFLLHALSSPQGKSICGFLEKKIFKEHETPDGIVKGEVSFNQASTLFNLLTKQIEQGKSFDKILIKLNKKYNEII